MSLSNSEEGQRSMESDPIIETVTLSTHLKRSKAKYHAVARYTSC
jgi:hypothetical protein